MTCATQYGGSPEDPTLDGVYALIDEAYKPIEELEPITYRTAKKPYENIGHFIQKFHGDRLYIHGDVMWDLGFNSWENGSFLFVWSISIIFAVLRAPALWEKLREKIRKNKPKKEPEKYIEKSVPPDDCLDSR